MSRVVDGRKTRAGVTPCHRAGVIVAELTLLGWTAPGSGRGAPRGRAQPAAGIGRGSATPEPASGRTRSAISCSRAGATSNASGGSRRSRRTGDLSRGRAPAWPRGRRTWVVVAGASRRRCCAPARRRRCPSRPVGNAAAASASSPRRPRRRRVRGDLGWARRTPQLRLSSCWASLIRARICCTRRGTRIIQPESRKWRRSSPRTVGTAYDRKSCPAAASNPAGRLDQADERDLLEAVDVDAAVAVGAGGHRPRHDDVGLDQLVHQLEAPGLRALLGDLVDDRCRATGAGSSRSLALRRSPRWAGTGGVVRVATICSFRAMGPCCRRPGCGRPLIVAGADDNAGTAEMRNLGQTIDKSLSMPPGIGAGHGARSRPLGSGMGQQRLRRRRRGIHRQVDGRARGARAARPAGSSTGRCLPPGRPRRGDRRAVAATTCSTCSSPTTRWTLSYDECVGVTYDDVHADPEPRSTASSSATTRSPSSATPSSSSAATTPTSAPRRARLQRPDRRQPRRAGAARAQRLRAASPSRAPHGWRRWRVGRARAPTTRSAARGRRQPRRPRARTGRGRRGAAPSPACPAFALPEEPLLSAPSVGRPDGRRATARSSAATRRCSPARCPASSSPGCRWPTCSPGCSRARSSSRRATGREVLLGVLTAHAVRDLPAALRHRAQRRLRAARRRSTGCIDGLGVDAADHRDRPRHLRDRRRGADRPSRAPRQRTRRARSRPALALFDEHVDGDELLDRLEVARTDGRHAADVRVRAHRPRASPTAGTSCCPRATTSGSCAPPTSCCAAASPT